MRTVARTLSALGLVLLASSLAFAQGTANFSGTWMLDKSKSDLPKRQRPGGETAQQRDVSVKLMVEQQGSTLKVTRTFSGPNREMSRTLTFNTAGQETTESTPRGGSIVSKASWEGDKLVITSTGTVTGRRGDRKVERKEMWSLSPDGKTLTIQDTVQSPRGERTMKRVYNKQ